MAGTAEIINQQTILNAGESLQNKALRDLWALLMEEIANIRKSLGAASGGTGAGILVGSVAWNPADLADGAGESKNVTVTGAALGDFAIVSIDGGDLAGATLSGYVSAADTVTARIQNESGSALNSFDAGTLRALVIPKRALAMAAMTLVRPTVSTPAQG